MAKMGSMSMEFTNLIAEAIGLPRGAFDRFFDKSQQHKLKIVKYPDLEELGVDGEAQGVGPHKDSMLTSYLLQASHHRGLQVQNNDGEWIDCPPIDGTFVVAIGQGMEALTKGVCQRYVFLSFTTTSNRFLPFTNFPPPPTTAQPTASSPHPEAPVPVTPSPSSKA